MNSGIYQIICLMNGKSYIGSAVNIKQRWRTHKSYLNLNKHNNRYLQNSWNKYGKEFFDFDIIEYCEINLLIEREQYYLDYMKPEFNICKIAESRLGTKHSEEWKKKHRLRMIGNTYTKGHKLSLEHCNKISRANMGKAFTAGKTFSKIKRRFSNEDIKKIRTSVLSIMQLSKEYSCAYMTIKNIKNYITYKDIF